MRPSHALVLASLVTSTTAVRAQDTPPGKPPVQEQAVDPTDHEAVARAQLQAALDAPITLDATEMPLEDVLALVRGPQLNLVVDPAAKIAERTVTLQLQGTARQVLDRVLGDARLQLRVWSGVLLVTAPGKDLGTPPVPGPDPAGQAIAGRRISVEFDGTSLLEVLSYVEDTAEVQLEVAPDAQRLVDGALVHAQLRDVSLPHALTLLTHLHGLTWRTNGMVRIEVRRPRVRAPIGAADGPLSKEEVATRLDAHVSLALEEGNVFDFAAQLEARTGLRIRVDNASKTDTLSLELDDVSVREVLEFVCDIHGARWTVEEGGVVVLQLLTRCDECGEPRGNVSPCPECGAR